MLDSNLLPLFLVAALVLALTPGPDTLFVVANTLRGGSRGGLIAVAGISVGCLAHALAAALGIGALVAAAPLWFDLIRIGGGVYLAWIGFSALLAAWRRWRAPVVPVTTIRADPKPARQVFSQALITNLLNPKVLIFFIAFLPQFVNPAMGSVAWQMYFLGMLFTLIGCGYLVLVALFTGRAFAFLGRHRWSTTVLEAVSGSIFLVLALRLLLPERRA
jgi:threonine/homoserine/homoserine lactone efflux protein